MPETTRTPGYPGIPAPMSENVLLPTVAALREAVELLTGQRPTSAGLAITDLTKRLDDLTRRVKALEGGP